MNCLLACKSDDTDDGNGGASGVGGAAGVTAGTVAGAAGTVAGAAGTVAGAAGTVAGTAGMAGMGATGAPMWSAIYTEVIVTAGCTAGALCHAGGAAGSMLPMNTAAEAYTALVNVPAMGMNLTADPMHCKDSGLTRVVPGDPAMSLLIQKLDGTQTCGTEMPPGGLLTEAQRTQVRTWVLEGAMNN